MQWNDNMDEAPRDGTWFLGYSKRHVGQCRYYKPKDNDPCPNLIWYMKQDGWPQPTHWMPLPEPPK